MMRSSLTLFLAVILLTSCGGTKVLMQGSDQEKEFKTVDQYIKQSETLNSYLFGFQLFDVAEQDIVSTYNEDHFFTPASVTKWLTLYTSTQYLQDSLAWVNVYEVDGKKIYQPMGDPTYLHPSMQTSSRITDYFRDVPEETIYWSNQHFQDEKYGSGWAWDDYTYSFQPQKSVFPIQSNLLRFEKDSIFPTSLPAEVYYTKSDRPTRTWGQNQFFMGEIQDKIRYVPFETGESIIENYFVERNHRFEPYDKPLRQSDKRATIYGQSTKNALAVLMKESDNHIAEQLLLQASQMELGKMNTAAIIKYTKENALADFADDLQWVDGSGLSRYNMVTPRAIVEIINRTQQEQGIDWLKDVLPAGGQSGTIKNYYSYNPARVYAKTGTLRHNHNLAGLVQAESGKWYIFCIMNNHFPGSSKTAKLEMENLLKIIIENY